MTFPSTPLPDAIGRFTLYAVTEDGTLRWHEKESADVYHGPLDVGTGWQGFVDVIPAGGNCLYARQPDGTLLWYRHDGFNDGTFAWTGPNQVGNGWSFPRIFSGGDGIVYAVTAEGALLWYRHNGFRDGGDVTTWDPPREIGTGWGDYLHIAGGGKGQIFAITSDGAMERWLHTGYADGQPTWDPNRSVNTEWPWNTLVRLVPIGDDRVLGVHVQGSLFFFRYQGATPPPPGDAGEPWHGQWEAPRDPRDEIGLGWAGYLQVFALLPTDPLPPG